MPDSKVFVAPFIGGLNTEQSTVQDLPEYTSDELNCTVYPEGIRGRRYGMSIERDGQFYNVTGISNPKAFQGYVWKNVGKTPLDFIVYQIDSQIHFYDAGNKPFSNAKNSATLDISKYITDQFKFYQSPIKFSTGAGFLIAVSKYMEPIKIEYNFGKQTFEASIIDIKFRDIDGIDDGLAIDQQPISLSNFHNYNLQNQGWSHTYINNFHTDKGSYPANNMQWFIGKDNSGNYNTEALLRKWFGNTPAPRGHFILNYFDRNRAGASGIYGGSARRANWAYRNTWKRDRSYRAVVITNFTVEYPSSNGTATMASVQFTRLARKVWKRSWGAYNANIPLIIEGLNSNGQWIIVHQENHFFYGTGEGETGSAEVFTMTWTNTTKYQKYRLRVNFPSIAGWDQETEVRWPCMVTCSTSLSIAEDGDPFQEFRSISTNRVTDIAYMSGKFFYLVNDTVLFSQNVTDSNKGYNLCYQNADPTSEEISDVVATDGGYVKFQTMGDGLALKTFNRGVLVFGRDVVYGLLSPTESRFTATEYDTVELSRAGLLGAQSVVSTASAVYYWSPLGIFKVSVNESTGNTAVAENISQLTIQSFYNNIPQYSKENCRGVFDFCNNRIYWFYPTQNSNITKLDGILMYDLNYNAFYPQKIEGEDKVVAAFETINSYEINPTIYLRAAGKRVVASNQYITVTEEDVRYNRYVSIGMCIISGNNKISFGDFNSREFKDWDKYMYDSYMISRPITIEGVGSYGPFTGTYNNKQVPILQTLFKRTETGSLKAPKKYIMPSGAYLRMRWGWSLNGESNRWDLIQNAYRPQKDFMNDEYVESRVHVRGRGKAYQIEVRNDSNKDFRLSGMNMLVRSY